MNYHARSVYIGHFLLILSKNVYIYLGKKENSFFSDFRYEFFSPDGKKNKTLFIVSIESLYLKEL